MTPPRRQLGRTDVQNARIEQWLPVWRQTRDPALHALIVAWDDVASTPLGPVLDHVVEGPVEVAWQRLDAVEAMLPDPRVLAGIQRWLRALPYRTIADSFYTRVFALIPRHASRDLSWVETLADEGMARQPSRSVERILGRLKRRQWKRGTAPFAAPVPLRELSDEERSSLEAFGGAEAAPTPRAERSPEGLLEAVAQDPDDDAPRLILADLLQQRDDPRGEFIALQFDASEEARQRARQLEMAHRVAWLGPAMAAAARVRWDRGFPERVELYQRFDKLPQLIGDPAWATVDAVRIGRPRMSDTQARKLVKLLNHPSLAHIRDVRWLQRRHVEKLVPAPGRRSVGITVVPGDPHPVVDAVNRLGLVRVDLRVFCDEQQMRKAHRRLKTPVVHFLLPRDSPWDPAALALSAHPARQRVEVRVDGGPTWEWGRGADNTLGLERTIQR